MKIDGDLGNRIRKVVKAYNKRVLQANKKAGKRVIEQTSMKHLRNDFLSKKSLEKELNRLERFTSAGTKTETRGDIELTKYQWSELEKDLSYAKRQRTRRLNKQLAKEDTSVGLLSDRYHQLRESRKALDRYDLNNLDEEKLGRLVKAVASETNRELYTKKFYDEFFDRVLQTQDIAHTDPVLVNTIKKRLSKLDPEGFLEAYNEEPYFKAVMEYIETKGFRKEMYGYQGKKSRIAIEEDRFNEIMSALNDSLPRLIQKYG